VLILASAENVAFITGAATVIAALILGAFAAWAAERRLTKQMGDAGDRQKRELADAGNRQKRELRADRRRQQATLTHDRELADLADLRTLLDEAAVALNDADEARIGLELGLTQHGRKVPCETLTMAREAGRALYALRERLFVRLGKKHAIALHFHEATAALQATWAAVSSLHEDSDAHEVQESRNIVRSKRESFQRACEGFIEAAVERAGTVAMSGEGNGV
jgi:hypothetical protein